MIGTIAGILTTLAFVPQVVKVLQTKDTTAISLGMYLMSVTGIFLWMVHGYVIGDMALLIANLITFCLALVILVAKLKYK
ncbi:MAG: SemiSWEET transporter [Trichococcus sp.]|jgi:MtN3 and saliva related transmembrane protein